jgi:broad specificity phosphatase PhoE
MEVYLIRHGETEWNVSGRFQGKLDSPLTENGVAQAQAMGKALSRIHTRFDALVASPLGRTRQTTSIITGFGIFPEPESDMRLAEVSVGSWDGLTNFEIDAQWPGLLEGSSAFDWFFRSPDGETYEDALERVTQWLADLDGSVIAISHGLIGRIIRGAYLGLSKDDALCLPVPQDVIWWLGHGKIEAITVA